MLTHERLKELLIYNPDTGLFIWQDKRGGRWAGRNAGTLHKYKGYRYIDIDGTKYMAHRLAWFFSYKVWPNDQIDHINGIRSDNKLVNLRDISQIENSQNQTRSHKNTKVGFLGVCARGEKYEARITVNRKQIQLGTFLTVERARDVYLEAKNKYHIGRNV